MTDRPPVNSRFEEDLPFTEAPGGPPRYQDWTEKPVQYFTVVDKERLVLGHVWAGDEDDAATYEPRKAGGPEAVNEGASWIGRLRNAKARGIRPSQALAELYADPEPGGRGRPLPGSLAEAPSPAVVEALAGPYGPVRMVHPVQYVTVTAPDGEVVGYVWGDAETAEWILRPAGSISAYDAGSEWYRKVTDLRERGLAPLAVLTELAREPGVGPVTGAPSTAAVEELARTVTPADDWRLLAQLRRDDHAAWQELADAFDALTDEDRNVQWGGGEMKANGVIQVAYPIHSKPLWRTVTALYHVGAVTGEHRWVDNPMPEVPPGGLLHPADAVRAATAVVRGERLCEGTLSHALKIGLFDAVGESLRAWYAACGTELAPDLPPR
ncbi:DUF6508 domain-containing protein [Streptomyces sp. NPDC001795]|uniref:DUF6508 domain-containing protein n=1 Tax=Streptomyces sp. NPDC001795 TaxID=3154525 RepID=UPI00332D31F3